MELYPDKFADVKIIGYDATPEQVKAMQEGRQIIASMAQNPMNIGSLAVNRSRRSWPAKRSMRSSARPAAW